MSSLILLNGPPGIGKSTLASRWADDHPGALNLDIDHVRMLVGGWCEDFVGAGETVRPLVLHMASAHLLGGRDVIVPQYLADTAEVQAFADVADAADARFLEVVLLDSRESSVARFAQRGVGGGRLHEVVDMVVANNGGDEYLEHMYDELLAGAAARDVVKVVCDVDAVERTYEQLCAAVASTP